MSPKEGTIARESGSHMTSFYRILASESDDIIQHQRQTMLVEFIECILTYHVMCTISRIETTVC